MILDSIKEYNEISERMKCEYVKNCKKCNGEGILKSNLGYVECTCMKKSKIIAREICNGVPERLIDKMLIIKLLQNFYKIILIIYNQI